MAVYLGKQINLVESPWAGCPFCSAPKTTMTVHLYGVQWPCGCSVAIPPIHHRPEESARCRRCNPIEESNVVPIRRSA